MQKTITIVAVLLLIFPSTHVYSQSFEETNFPDITTTPSASRSANFIDVNGDGWDDVFITNGPFAGENNMLYINNQNGTFTTVNADHIVQDGDRSDGASFADADNDGDLDAFVVTYGANGVGKKNYFYRNNGDGTFTYEPNIAMGIPLTYSEMATWIDANNDQHLDLYITNSLQNLRNLYFENQGNGSFLEVTDLAITDDLLPSRSVDWVDYNGDGKMDLFVTNENNRTNSLFRNNGPDDFTQITNLDIVTENSNTAGSSWADIDNDGDFDLFVANWANTGQANQLFINNDGIFTEDTNSAVANEITSSFGSTFGDVDNDGDLDLFVCNAFLAGHDTNMLYINDGDGNFTLDVTSDLSSHQGWTFGAAFGDYDNDGWLDLLMANTINESQTNSIYHNTGSGNNWVKLNCQGTTSNSSAVGAKVQMKAIINGNEVIQTRRISSAIGYCSQNSYTVHFGLGDAATIDELKIIWPSGLREVFSNIDINTIHTIVEGTGTLGNVENEFDFFTAYPNPVDSIFRVASKKFIGATALKFTIYSSEGKQVGKPLDLTLDQQKGEANIDLSFLSSGVYIFSVSSEEKKLVQGKLVKG